MKQVCPEWRSQGILGGKVDEPPKTSICCNSQRARYERHAKSLDLQQTQEVEYVVPGSRLQGNAINPEVKITHNLR